MSTPKKETCHEKTFSDFYHKHVSALRNFLLYKFGDEQQAEDITQDSFIKLWQNCNKVPLEKAKSYIYTLANNASINVYNHQKVILKYKKTTTSEKTTIENPQFLMEEAEFKTKLLTAIQNLNETHRVAFLMHRIDGKKYAEIAEELNISVKAVEKRIHNALLELRKEFDFFK